MSSLSTDYIDFLGKGVTTVGSQKIFDEWLNQSINEDVSASEFF